MKVLFTADSGNRKIGHIAASYTSRDSCPDNCKLKVTPDNPNGECYAEGFPTAFQWNKTKDGSTDKKGNSHRSVHDWDDFCRQVNALPRHKVFRHNVAGDFPGYKGNNNSINREMLDKLDKACARVQAFTFTHKPVGFGEIGETADMMLTRARNGQAIKKCNKEGNIAINLSAESLADADRMAELDIGPVVTVVGSDAPRHMKTPGGRHVVVCPNEEDENRTCDLCLLCAKPNRKAIVAFRAHGYRGKKLTNRVNNTVHLKVN
jgi:hypothetical protein